MGVFAVWLSSVPPVGVISMLYIQSRLSTLTLTLLPSCTPQRARHDKGAWLSAAAQKRQSSVAGTTDWIYNIENTYQQESPKTIFYI